MADVAASFKSWSSTVGSNLPSSSTTIGAGLAPNFQQIQATLRTELGSRSTALTAAATTDLNTKDEGTVLVSNASGTIAITSFGTVSAGIKKLITFSVTGGSLSLTYNATSMILPSSANITVANGDSLIAESLGSGNWKIHAYYKAVGMAGLDDLASNSLPVGTVGMTFANLPPFCMYIPNAPTNLNRASYPEFHAEMARFGYPYGAGDGVSTFGMPYMPTDYAAIQLYGAGYGNSVGEVISHFHAFSETFIAQGTVGNNGLAGFTGGYDAVDIGSTVSTGGAANKAAGMRVFFYVKYK